MAADRGKQFEYAVMIAALSRFQYKVIVKAGGSLADGAMKNVKGKIAQAITKNVKGKIAQAITKFLPKHIGRALGKAVPLEEKKKPYKPVQVLRTIGEWHERRPRVHGEKYMPGENGAVVDNIKTTYAALMNKTSNGRGIETAVKQAAKKMIDKIEPRTGRNDFYKSFKQLGGGVGGGGEPKTDIMFLLSGKKYKCSLKWGDKYQLSSGGISNTAEVLRKVLANSFEKNTIQEETAEEITKFITEFENTLGPLPKRGEQAVMKKAMEANPHLKEKLEQFLGTRKVLDVADSYKFFKDAVVKESLTGELMFGKSNDKSANYILNETALKPINAALIKSVSDITYVRLRLKGRGQTDLGVRLNELVVSIEPK